MKTPRILLPAIALGFAAAGTFAVIAPSSASPSHLTSKPAVGRCRNLTAAQAAPMTNSSPTVPCSSPHTTYTFAVPNLPRSVNVKHLTSAKLEVAGIRACMPGYRKLLGRSWGVEEQSVLNFSFFAPPAAQRAHGARWVRCDLILIDGPKLGQLPTVHRPVLGSGIPDAVRRCYTQDGHYVPCTETHNERAVTAITVHSTKRLTEQQFIKQGEARCPAGDRAFFSWPNKYDWALGDHVEVCYRATRS